MSSREGLTSTKAIRLKHIQDSNAPDAYINYNECERKCNDLVENFLADFLQSYPHLKDRLFLQPRNEFGKNKFVCSFIQPTILPYNELYNLRSCAEFIARYLVYEPLEDGETTVVTPAQTLTSGVGDCFDYSFLLASLLIGAGYDAFVVLGMAPDWIRLKDQGHMHMALKELGSGDNDTTRPWSVEVSIKDECYKQKTSNSDGIHCWLLVKSGKREGGTCLVEPSTGILYPVGHDSPYSQVFSVWSERHCWLNIGDGSIGVEGFDFSNTSQWLPVLPDAHSTPCSWVNALSLSKEQFLLRYPGGSRRIVLSNEQVELFGENVDPKGVVSRVIQYYEDTARTIVVECTELFCPTRRVDHMIQRTRRPMDNMNHIYYSLENDMFMRERKEIIMEGGKQLRYIGFYEKTRADGLLERIEEANETGSSITERFLNRADGLVRRVVSVIKLPKDVKKPKSSSQVFPGAGLVIERIE